MIQIPVNINGEQASHLNALLMRGDPDLLILDQQVQGAPLVVIIARGAARDHVRQRLTSQEEMAPAEPEPTPEGPPVKVVPIRDGVRDNDPGAPKAR